MTPEMVMSLIPRPPFAVGLSRELASVAPSARVRTKAAQNRSGRETSVRKKWAATTASATAISAALPL